MLDAMQGWLERNSRVIVIAVFLTFWRMAALEGHFRLDRPDAQSIGDELARTRGNASCSGRGDLLVAMPLSLTSYQVVAGALEYRAAVGDTESWLADKTYEVKSDI